MLSELASSVNTNHVLIWLIIRHDSDENSDDVMGIYSSQQRAESAMKAFEAEESFMVNERIVDKGSRHFSLCSRPLDITVLEGDESGIWIETDRGRVGAELA